MTTYQSPKVYSAKAVTLVKRIKELSSELVLATSQEDPVNKYCFDGAIAERAKSVECAKEKYDTTAKGFDNVNEQLKSAIKRLEAVNLEYVNVREANKSLQNEIQNMKGKHTVQDEVQGWSDCRSKLNLYKKLTGLHFDFNMESDDLTGFIAIKGDEKCHSGLEPFAVKRDDPNIPAILWGKIYEVLKTMTEDQYMAAAMNHQNKLETKHK